MHGRASTCRAVGHAGCFFRGADEVGDRFDRGVCADFEHDGGVAEQADAREVLAWIERYGFLNVRIQRVSGDRAEADGVAIGRSFGHGVHADVAASTGAVFNDDRLTQCRAHILADDARDHIGWAACGETYYEADGACGVVR